MADEPNKTFTEGTTALQTHQGVVGDLGDRSLEVISRVTIMRRVDDNFETIAPNTPFMCISQAELEDYRKKNAIFGSVQEKVDFERAIEGTNIPRTRPNITLTPVSEAALIREAAHAANRLTGNSNTVVETGTDSAAVIAARKRVAEQERRKLLGSQ